MSDIKKKKAVALEYNLTMPAPKVVASGTGHLAQKIIDTAKGADVKTHYNPALVEELSKIDIGMEIPPGLYEIVAQILVFIDDLDRLEGLKRNG